ncbi:MAG: TIGR03790 family protein [Verrucomicrobia bacterium]|nr:TIGR03790 family protein [Verrucomicrobiota bacterium]
MITNVKGMGNPFTWPSVDLLFPLVRVAAAVCVWIFATNALGAGHDEGGRVAVVYNSRMAESKSVADYYAEHRGVPAENMIGLKLPLSETMRRDEFRKQVQEPLLEILVERGLFEFGDSEEAEDSGAPASSKIRYLVLCYGVPLKIIKAPDLKSDRSDTLRPELMRNEAAVDSELALLPRARSGYPVTGPVENSFYGATNPASIKPENGLLMVSRLDGPNAEIAKGLVDKALSAETNGLWGRAYFDARGITNSGYVAGDEWIRQGARITERLGFETVLDEEPSTFRPGFPMSHVAIYAGWYDMHVSGPFALRDVEFMPGAFAYHLHSASASSIRTSEKYWVGPLLTLGAAVTMGTVYEPYLEFTPNVPLFLSRFLRGFSFGEAAYASSRLLSWQTTVVGDPLYRPYGRPPWEIHSALSRRDSSLIEWSHLRIVCLNQAVGAPSSEVLGYLNKIDATTESAILQEKAGKLHEAEGRLEEASVAYRHALELEPSKQQRIRLYFELARVLSSLEEYEDAAGIYIELLEKCPAYPDAARVYRNLVTLYNKIGNAERAAEFEKKLEESGAGVSE